MHPEWDATWCIMHHSKQFPGAHFEMATGNNIANEYYKLRINSTENELIQLITRTYTQLIITLDETFDLDAYTINLSGSITLQSTLW